ncbi:MAG: serine protease [Solirubrobacterales bacterium]
MGGKTRKGIIVAALAALLLGAAPATAKDAKPRIVGGAPTTIEQYPWQVAIERAPNGQSAFNRQFCGGSLIAPTVVVTAAHCVFNTTGPEGTCLPIDGFNTAPSSISVISGRTFLDGTDGKETAVTEIFYLDGSATAPTIEAQTTGDRRGLYDCNTQEFDVALLQIASAAPPPAAAIKIAGADETGVWAPGKPAFASGWGALSEGGTFPDQLHAVQLSYLDDSVCSDPSRYGTGYFPQTMLCAGELAGGKDTCQGDSGGPLVALTDNGVRLIGDTSFGVGCARPNFPGVYGRLASDPIRSAVENGVKSIGGVDPIGTGATPAGPPETTISNGPKPTVKTKKRKVTATFRFSASEPSSFACSLDGRAASACTSPASVKVRKGRHTFSITATDNGSGSREPDPAVFAWRVKRKKN